MEDLQIKTFDMQPVLQDDLIVIKPLKEDDFEGLFEVASDPEIWIQHPNKERYKRDVFIKFFQGAIESKGAFLVTDKKTGGIIGSSRYYNLPEITDGIAIGYTFLAKHCWGNTFNRSLKKLMLDHAFNYVETVYFHIGKINIRSQKAIEKLGAEKIGQKEMLYYGEQKYLNYIYVLKKSVWEKINNSYQKQ